MVLDNWATFASFVSQFAPIKILPWQGKKKKNIIMILMIIINYVKSSKNGWAKHFFPLQRVYTRRDESWRLQSRQYLLWVFHAEIGNHKYSFHVKERKKRKIHVFANTGLWMYAGLLVPSNIVLTVKGPFPWCHARRDPVSCNTQFPDHW